MTSAPKKPTSPHDALFRAVFTTPAHMAEELAVVLPDEVKSCIDLGSLTPEAGHFVDANLEGAETDLLFSARTAAGRALVYVLVEHQSAPDRYMPLRLLRYVGRILDAHRRRQPVDPLPPVLPVVLYHAERPWPYPLDLASLYALKPIPGALTPHVIDFRFVLDDLARAPALSLAARPVSPLVAVTLFLFKRARYARDILAELQGISAVLQRLDASLPPDEQ
jgi:predicted transposase/invertase (TIGR01784 family)